MALYDLLVLSCSVLPAVCMVYLAKHYIEKKQIVTLLLAIFFALFAGTYIGYYLILIDVLQIHLVTYIVYTALIYFSVVLFIGIVMMRLRELYVLPFIIATIAIIHHNFVDYSRDLLLDTIQYLSLVINGSIIGNPWFIILSRFDPSLFVNVPYFTVLRSLLEPLFLLSPDTQIVVMATYLGIISAPTIILFYFIAWKNRSGRSLGFALGLTLITLNMNSPMWMPEEIHALVTLVATVFFALGIFGVLDRIIKIKESKKVLLKDLEK